MPPAEHLAQKYAPIAYLKRQDAPCDADGEPYRPAPVEVVFGDPNVVHRQIPDRRVLDQSITAAALSGRDASHYVDLPGHPRTFGCGDERHFLDARLPGLVWRDSLPIASWLLLSDAPAASHETPHHRRSFHPVRAAPPARPLLCGA